MKTMGKGTPGDSRGMAGEDIAEPAGGDAQKKRKSWPCGIPERPKNARASLKMEWAGSSERLNDWRLASAFPHHLQAGGQKILLWKDEARGRSFPNEKATVPPGCPTATSTSDQLSLTNGCRVALSASLSMWQFSRRSPDMWRKPPNRRERPGKGDKRNCEEKETRQGTKEKCNNFFSRQMRRCSFQFLFKCHFIREISAGHSVQNSISYYSPPLHSAWFQKVRPEMEGRKITKITNMKNFPRTKGSAGTTGCQAHWAEDPTKALKFQNLRDKEKILKASLETQKRRLFYKGWANRIASDGSIKTSEVEENRARYQNPEGKWFQPVILHSVQLSIKCRGGIKPFSGMQVYFSWHKPRKRVTWDSGGPYQDCGKESFQDDGKCKQPVHMEAEKTEDSRREVCEGKKKKKPEGGSDLIAWCLEMLKGCWTI